VATAAAAAWSSPAVEDCVVSETVFKTIPYSRPYARGGFVGSTPPPPPRLKK